MCGAEKASSRDGKEQQRQERRPAPVRELAGDGESEPRKVLKKASLVEYPTITNGGAGVALALHMSTANG